MTIVFGAFYKYPEKGFYFTFTYRKLINKTYFGQNNR